MTGESAETRDLFRRSVAEFVEKDVTPVADAIDEKGVFPVEQFQRVASMGYFGLRYPEKYGGAGGDAVMFCILAEELARGSLSLAAITMMQCLMGTDFVAEHGTEAQRQRLLVPAIRGEKIGTFALTEPGAGSDLGAIKTTAVREGGEWVITGQKTWITSGTRAHFFTVGALTRPERGLKGIDFFLVERGTPGLQVGHAIPKMSVRASETTELSFDGCRVPEENMLGAEGEGYANLQATLSEIRTMTGALGLGVHRAALDESRRWAKERVQFGQPIGKFQATQMKIAQMATELEASRHLVYAAAERISRGEECTKQAAMAKLFASEAANRAADEATRIFASYGLSTEMPAQRHFRDARFLLFGGGTSEILRLIIAKSVSEGG